MNLTENMLLELLTEETKFPELDETKHVTRRMLAQSAHVSYDKATEKLEALVSEGKLVKFQARTSLGQIVMAYRKT